MSDRKSVQVRLTSMHHTCWSSKLADLVEAFTCEECGTHHSQEDIVEAKKAARAQARADRKAEAKKLPATEAEQSSRFLDALEKLIVEHHKGRPTRGYWAELPSLGWTKIRWGLPEPKWTAKGARK